MILTATSNLNPSTPDPCPITMKTPPTFQLPRAFRLRGAFLAALAAPLLFSMLDLSAATPLQNCASCEEILLTGRGTNSGYYDISPDGVVVINAYCSMTNGHGWTVIDPAHDTNWGRFFRGWNLYAGGLAYGNGISCSSWRQWFALADTNTQFATSPNGRGIGLEVII
jgi:hypothetical protein